MKTQPPYVLREFIESAAILIVTLFVIAGCSSRVSAELVPLSVWPANTLLQTGAGASFEVAMSPDARFVLFTSSAGNLVPTNFSGGHLNLFLRDRSLGKTILVSPSANGSGAGNGDSPGGTLTDDGRFIVFESTSSNLTGNDSNSVMDVFLRDVQLGTTEMISRGVSGPVNAQSSNPSVSTDGQRVAFESVATNLVANDLNALSDVFIFDEAAQSVSLVSGGPGGSPLNGTESHSVQVTSDGKAAIFWSKGTNLVTGAASLGDVYYRDLVAQRTYFVSTNAQALVKSVLPAVSLADLVVSQPAATRDGRYIAYKMSFAQANKTYVALHDMTTFTTLLVATNANASSELDTPNLSISADGKRIAYSGGGSNIYVWDANSGQSELVNVNGSGTAPGSGFADSPSISADGSKVVFESNAADLVDESVAGVQIYLRDLALDSTLLINVGLDDSGEDIGGATVPSISSDGRFISFNTLSDSIVAGDQNRDYDVFVRDSVQPHPELISGAEPLTGQAVAPGICADCQSVVTDDARFAVFFSPADLTPIPVFGVQNVYRRDIVNQTTLLVSVSSGGLRGANYPCSGVSLSGNGNVVVFVSAATNLTAHAPNSQTQVFARNISSNSTTLVSVNQSGQRGAGNSTAPSIDYEGRRIVFASTAANLVTPSSNTGSYLRDLATGQTLLIGQSGSIGRITSDGRFAAAFDFSTLRLSDLTAETFTNYAVSQFSFSHNSRFFVTAKATALANPLFVRDLQQGTDTTISGQNLFFATISDDGQKLAGFGFSKAPAPSGKFELYDLASQSLQELPLNAQHTQTSPLLSPNGRYIAYETDSSITNTANDNNTFSDVALYDLELQQLRLISVSRLTGFAADSLSIPLAVLNDGSVVFESFADDVAEGATYGTGAMYLFRNTLTDTDHDGIDDLLEMSLSGSLSSNGFRVISLNLTTSGSLDWTINWQAQPGARYTVEYKHSLADSNWAAASGVITAPEGTTSLSFSDSANTFTDAKYYRVVQLQ